MFNLKLGVTYYFINKNYISSWAGIEFTSEEATENELFHLWAEIILLLAYTSKQFLESETEISDVLH